MEKNKFRLGDLTEEYNEINVDGELNDISYLQGINNAKYFQESNSNKNDIDLLRYKICRNNTFAYNKATSRNGEKISIAYRTDGDCLVSPSYICFRVVRKDLILDDYLMLWFRRPVFDRYVRFNSWGSATEFFTYSDFAETEIELPSIERQTKIVNFWKTISRSEDSISNSIETIGKIVNSYYNYIFVGCPYKDDEFDRYQVPDGYKVAELGDYITSYSKTHKYNKKKLIFLNTSDIYNGNILTDEEMDISDMPGQAKKEIANNDILFSEIRPANKRFALISLKNPDDYIVSTKLMVLRRINNELSIERLYHYLTKEETLGDLQFQAEGSSGTFPQITFDENLKHRRILVADPIKEKEFEKLLKEYYRLYFIYQDEMKQLTGMKDKILSSLK